MPLPEIGSYHPPDKSRTGNSNYLIIGPITIFYSYSTIVAFSTPPTGLVVSENVWGTTTAKHLNWIDEDKSARLPRDKFKEALEAMLADYKLN